MIRYLTLASLYTLLLLLAGCGGGGSPGVTNAAIVGRVLNVQTGGPLNPAGSIQAGVSSSLTSISDGSFTVQAPVSIVQLLVDTRSPMGVFNFTIAPGSGTSTRDVGDLWVGPEQVQLTGRVLNSVTGQPVPNASVQFGGRAGTTNSQGVFSLADVAYSSQTQTAFWGIVGVVRAAGFFRTEFSAAPSTAAGGTVTVDDVLLTPSDDPNPPGPPYNVWGRVSPSSAAQGTVVTLLQSGTPIRVFNVGSDNSYYFWVEPGTYTVTYVKGTLSAPTQTVTLNQQNEVVRRDVTLN
jgi:hypothetical protein